MFTHQKSGFENDLEPTEFYLSPNYPNPFKKKTKIKYCVAQTTRVILTVFDSEVNKIIKLVDREQNPGTYEVEFNVSQDSSLVKENKVYFYQLEAGDYKCLKEMILSNKM